MITRRTFIKSTLAANIALVAPATLALTAIKSTQAEQALLIFADEKSPNAGLFAEQFSESKFNESQSNINLDIGLHFDTFNTFCNENSGGWVSGITRDSDFFVLQQLAAQHGYYTAYSATHTSAAGALTHRVTSNADKAPLVAQALANAGAKWPIWLAENLAILQNKTVTNSTADSQIQSLPTTNDGNILVSWLFVPNNSTSV
ncbi:MAG: hypothetical protein ABGX33_03465 [Cycloclasticus sp.]